MAESNGFGQNVRRFREARDLSQEGLARELAVSYMTVSRWERGEHKPDIDTVYRLADVLGVTVGDLLEAAA